MVLMVLSLRSCENDRLGWIVGYRMAARKVRGSAPQASMLFDKDNPVTKRGRSRGYEQ